MVLGCACLGARGHCSQPRCYDAAKDVGIPTPNIHFPRTPAGCISVRPGQPHLSEGAIRSPTRSPDARTPEPPVEARRAGLMQKLASGRAKDGDSPPLHLRITQAPRTPSPSSAPPPRRARPGWRRGRPAASSCSVRSHPGVLDMQHPTVGDYGAAPGPTLSTSLSKL